MRLSTKSRYGVRALFDIAYHSEGSPTQIKEISRRQGITPRYLEQIFQRLKRAGIVKSIRGPKGGYYLARKPEEIVLSEIIQAMDDSIEPVFCARPGKDGRSAAGNPNAWRGWFGRKPGAPVGLFPFRISGPRCARWPGRWVWKNRRACSAAPQGEKVRGERNFS